MDNGTFGQRPAKSPLWQGYIRPRIIRRQGTPLLDDSLAIGKSGNFYTSLKFRVYSCSLQYPTPSYQLTMANGAGSTFARITIDEFPIIIAKLQEWQSKLNALLPVIQAQQSSIDNQRKTLDLLSAMQGDSQEQPVDNDYIPELEVPDNGQRPVG